MRKKKVLVWTLVFIVLVLIFGTSCSSCERDMKTCTSEMNYGLNRVVNVYDYQGDLIAKYEGKIDIEENDTKVLFDLDGKRYIYYNCLVEVIEK